MVVAVCQMSKVNVQAFQIMEDLEDTLGRKMGGNGNAQGARSNGCCFFQGRKRYGLCFFRRGSIMISWRYLENDTPLKVNM